MAGVARPFPFPLPSLSRRKLAHCRSIAELRRLVAYLGPRDGSGSMAPPPELVGPSMRLFLELRSASGGKVAVGEGPDLTVRTEFTLTVRGHQGRDGRSLSFDHTFSNQRPEQQSWCASVCLGRFPTGIGPRGPIPVPIFWPALQGRGAHAAGVRVAG